MTKSKKTKALRPGEGRASLKTPRVRVEIVGEARLVTAVLDATFKALAANSAQHNLVTQKRGA